MKKHLKLTALLLVVLMFVSVLAGCGKKMVVSEYESWIEDDFENEYSSQDEVSSDVSSDETNSNTSSDNNQVSSTTSNTSSGGNQNEGKIDYNGKTVVMSGWSEGLAPKATSYTYKEEVALIKKIEKTYNCKIEYKTIYDSMEYYAAFVTAASAGVHFADIVHVPGDQAFPSAALNGYARCLDGYFDFDSPQWRGKVVNGTLLLNNKHYYLCQAGNGAGGGTLTWFNPTLFEKFGQKNPHQYVKENNWNWETFRQVAKTMTRKEGTTQYYGLAEIKVLFESNCCNFIDRKNGKEVFNADSKEGLEALQFAYDLYNTDKVIPTDGTGTAKFTSGYVAMCIDESWKGYAQDNGMYATFVPIGPSAKDYNYVDTATGLWLLPTTLKEKNMKVMAAILTDYTAVYKWRKTAIQSLEEVYIDEDTINALLEIGKRSSLSDMFSVYYPWTYRNIKWSKYGIDKQESYKAFLASTKKTAQAEIDAMWAKLSKLK